MSLETAVSAGSPVITARSGTIRWTDLSGPRLGDVAVGRDNNFNLIRFIAASAVLVSHAWPLALGDGTPEPLSAMMGHSLGSMAVFIFFAASGFFITSSFMRSNAAVPFLKARALRLFPGLIVSLVLVALVMGPLTTTLPIGEYLTHHEVWRFLLDNTLLVNPQFTLPGVFETNPYPTVEGSIWTLVHEVACYGLVFLAGMAGLLGRPRLMAAAIIVYAVLWLLPEFVNLGIPGKLMQTRRLSLPFVMGMAFWLWRRHIPLSFVLMAVFGLLAWLAVGTRAAFPLLSLSMTYTIFWLAYIPGGRIREFNRLGDYSYGIYVYAFPLQGLAVWMFGTMTPLTNILISFPLTLLCAVLSWRWVEAPALAFVHPKKKAGRAQAA